MSTTAVTFYQHTITMSFACPKMIHTLVWVKKISTQWTWTPSTMSNCITFLMTAIATASQISKYCFCYSWNKHTHRDKHTQIIIFNKRARAKIRYWFLSMYIEFVTFTCTWKSRKRFDFYRRSNQNYLRRKRRKKNETIIIYSTKKWETDKTRGISYACFEW